ncbi:MAG: glycosyltransferase [Candidatus Cloacimonetes bacterium]|nr:glycosyltransferase [Candidatus Cloacimonadota bacterium]
MELIFLVCSIFYFSILFIFVIGIIFQDSPGNTEINRISVIVAARNEEKHLPELLRSLANQEYPTDCYEVVIVDDRSEDKTSELVKEYEAKNHIFKLLKVRTESKYLLGKKGALDMGIRASKHDILAFIDADCTAHPNWLKQINLHFDEKTDLVAGYSYIYYNSLFFRLLKNLERASIFAIIAGSFSWNWGITATAGNLSYRKKLFHKVGGFHDIGNVRSGDDDLMVQKMSKFTHKMRFMFHKDSIVKTGRKETASTQIQQETRRGSKWKYYPISIKIITLFVLIYYILFSINFIGFLAGYFTTYYFVTFMGLKLLPEFLLILFFLIKINKISLLIIFPILEIIYIPYFIFFGLKGTFGNYKWKE